MAEKMNGLSIELLSHPGETLKEVLESNNMTQKELSARIGLSLKHINQIVSGLVGISSETSFKLEKVFPLSASFWNNLQMKYEEEKLQIMEENEVKQEEIDVFQSSIYNDIVKYGYITREQKIAKKIIQLREFLGVSCLLNVTKTINSNALFRKSEAVSTNEFALATWMKICEIETNSINVSNNIDYDLLKLKLSFIRDLNSSKDPNYIVDQLQKIFAECGVAFAVVRNIKGAPVQGFIRKINNKIRLCLTLRNKYADIFWFTLFHEIGHLFDIKNEVYVDFSEKVKSTSELKADRFASDILIPKEEYDRFIRMKDFSKRSIIEFSKGKQILPGILVGRLHHDGIIPNSNCNDLRVKYAWAE